MKLKLLLSLLALACCATFAQAPRKAISTTTRQVAMFSELESKLETAFQKQDAARLEKILTDDFEVWSPRPSGDPIARDEWLQTAPELRPQSFKVRQMAVRTFGQIYVVSFTLTQTISGAQQSHFIVDVWRGAGGAAKLQVRYQSAAPTDSVPAQATVKP
jgi:hypothetical protein